MFSDRVFSSFLFVRVSVGLSSTILSVTIGWHLYQATGDAFDLALVGLMQILPIMLLFIVSGWVVDNFSRKHILLCCLAIQLLVFIGLALAMQSIQQSTTPVFVLLFISGASRAFFSPAIQSILPNIVSRADLARAVAFTSMAWTGAMTVGPFVAGLLIAAFDLGTYWVLTSLSVLSFIAALQLPFIKAVQSTQRGLTQLLDGIRFVTKNPIVLPSITLDMLIVLAGSITALLPVFAVDILQVGPETLGVLRAMPALGAFLAGAVLSRILVLRHSGNLLFAALILFATSILVFGLSENLWISLIALFVYGAADMVSVNVRSTLIQLATPDSLRGRVTAVNSLFIATSNDLGDFRAGSMVAAIGTVPAVLAGAGAAFIVTIAGYWLSPKLRTLDRLSEADHELLSDPPTNS